MYPRFVFSKQSNFSTARGVMFLVQKLTPVNYLRWVITFFTLVEQIHVRSENSERHNVSQTGRDSLADRLINKKTASQKTRQVTALAHLYL